jgi:O-antigen/teichoic acid export membrane protein
MKALFKKLFGESLVYGLSGIISSFISIFLIPLYTSVFDPVDYGVISLLLTTFTLLSLFIIFSMDNSAVVWFWDKPEQEERKKTFTSWIIFIICLGVGFCLLLTLLSEPLSRLYFGTSRYYLLFILVGINLLFAGFQKAANVWFRMLQKPFHAMIYSIVLLIMTVGCNVLFVLYWKVGIKGIFYSQAISSLLGFIMLFILLGKWIKLSSFSKNRLKEMVRFSFPLVPATLMMWLMNAASVFFIKYFVKDNAEIGLFQIGLSVANLLGLATWSFFQAWPAFALSVAKKENARQIYSITMELFCVAGFFIAFSLFLTSKDILLIFTNEKYLGAKDVIGLLGVNIILQGIPNILAIANFITKNNNSYAIATIIGSIVSILGFIVLIPRFGKEGAAVAMVLGNLFIPAYLYFFTQKLYYVPYKFDRIGGFILLQGALFIGAYMIIDNFWMHIVIIVAIALMLSGIYYQIAKRSGLVGRHVNEEDKPVGVS